MSDQERQAEDLAAAESAEPEAFTTPAARMAAYIRGGGVIVPLITARSVVQPKAEKLTRAVIEASKQCGRNVLMAVEQPANFEQFESHVDGKVKQAAIRAAA